VGSGVGAASGRVEPIETEDEERGHRTDSAGVEDTP